MLLCHSPADVGVREKATPSALKHSTGGKGKQRRALFMLIRGQWFGFRLEWFELWTLAGKSDR